MSDCECEKAMNYRVTGEMFWEDGMRVRCSTCGGKVGFIPIDLLLAMGVTDGDLHSGAPCVPAKVIVVDLH